MNAKKIAASLPGEQFQAVERLRRRLHLKRSEAIQEALALWLRAREGDERVAQYIRGYARQPDDSREGRAFTQAWAKGIESEDW
jgi:metal-responsive CopG/Arc/MetJ family transcriptional regulator